MMHILALFSSLVLLSVILVIVLLWKRNVFIWLPHWILRPRVRHHHRPIHIMFCFVDHFEPRLDSVSLERERERLDLWLQCYPRIAAGHRDADGVHPQHTFFYPEEEYREEHIEKLVRLCRSGFGEIEVHLHHDNDNSDNLRRTLTHFTELLCSKHGALPRDERTGQPRYAFIHGNWCLDNSRRDGRMCGVNDELIVLRETGCYADFTFPSAPSETQTSTVNSIYYATDDPEKPKSHDRGSPVTVGGRQSGDLMIIQGPLAFNLHQRKWGIIPRIENAEIRLVYPPSEERIKLWVRQGIHVRGKPDWLFVKIHTHGCYDDDMQTLLGPEMEHMFSCLEKQYNDGEEYVLHYVTAREMYNIIKAAEAGETGDPGRYRDYVIPPPAMLRK